jgi:hypothetical protein
MLRRYVRYLPYAFVVWFCRRNSERFYAGSLLVTNPFKGEFIGWLPDTDHLAPPRALDEASHDR